MLNRIIRNRQSRDHRLENLDRTEVEILRIARRIFHGLATTAHDPMSLEQALEVDPDRLNSVVPLRLMLVINAMRRARSSCFIYANPFCPRCQSRLTREERLFVAVFRAVVQQQKTTAHANAMILCEGGDTRAFLSQMQELARLVPAQAG